MHCSSLEYASIVKMLTFAHGDPSMKGVDADWVEELLNEIYEGGEEIPPDLPGFWCVSLEEAAKAAQAGETRAFAYGELFPSAVISLLEIVLPAWRYTGSSIQEKTSRKEDNRSLEQDLPIFLESLQSSVLIPELC